MFKFRKITLILGLGLIAWISSWKIPSSPDYISLLAVTVSIVGVLSSLLIRKTSYILAGLALITLPSQGEGVLSLFFAFWLMGQIIKASPKKQTSSTNLRNAIFLQSLLLLLGGAISFFHQSDLSLLMPIVEHGGVKNLLAYLEQTRATWQDSFYITSGFVLSFILVLEVQKSKESHNFMKGIVAGSIISVLFLFAQLLELHPLFSHKQNAFWVFTKRYSASFSDPNAFGIMAFLLLPLILFQLKNQSKRIAISLTAILAIASLFSGSRTSIIGLVLFSVLLFLRNRTKEENKKVVPFIVLGLFLTIASGYPPLNKKLQSLSPATSVARTLKTTNWHQATDMLYSRAIYNRIALEVWKNSPFFGVGVNRFFVKQEEAAKNLKIDLKGWRDNANNYYAQILAEQGIFGLLLCFFSFYFFYLALEKSNKVATTLLLSFVIVLLSGPHIFFEEVRYLIAFLIAHNVTTNQEKSKKWAKPCITLFSWATIFTSIIGWYLTDPLPKGIYRSEKDQEGKHFIWTSKVAQIRLCEGEQKIYFSSPTKNIPQKLELKLFSERKLLKHQSLALNDTDWRSITLKGNLDNSTLRIETGRVWNPTDDGIPDPRLLGVMFRPPSCR